MALLSIFGTSPGSFSGLTARSSRLESRFTGFQEQRGPARRFRLNGRGGLLTMIRWMMHDGWHRQVAGFA